MGNKETLREGCKTGKRQLIKGLGKLVNLWTRKLRVVKLRDSGMMKDNLLKQIVVDSS